MAGGKLTPRQKMINMMYLVLTALLALNISKDILQALTKLDGSLAETVQTVEGKNADIYRIIDNAAKENPEKAGKWRDKALEVKSEAQDLNVFIEDIKTNLVEMTGGRDEETNVPIGLDKKEQVANYLLNEKHATDLKQKIEAYRALLLEQAEGDEALTATINKTFDTSPQKVGEDGVQTDWENAKFEHYPLAAVLPFLTDIQAKVRNTESDVISKLYNKIGGDDIKISKVVPVVVPNSTYITQGDEYEADIYLAAFDETQEPEIYINGNRLPADQISGGVGTYKMKANSLGEIKWGGEIVLKQIGGDKRYPIEPQTFTVAPPTAVISPTKMNVLYRGVENPLEIGVPGVDPAKIRVSGPGVSGGNGNYMANVTNVKGREMDITVSVEDEDGTRQVGSKKFRIKGLPPALGTMYKKTGGQLGSSLIKSGKVEASYEDFPFDMELDVTSFEVVIPGFPPERVSGNTMPSSVKTRIDRMKPGETIIIREIKAKGPKGVRIPQVASISFDVN